LFCFFLPTKISSLPFLFLLLSSVFPIVADIVIQHTQPANGNTACCHFESAQHASLQPFATTPKMARSLATLFFVLAALLACSAGLAAAASYANPVRAPPSYVHFCEFT
jgi:hypothetical protein